LKLVAGLEVFNGYEYSEYLGEVKVAKVSNHFGPLSKIPPNPLKRLLDAQDLEFWTRCLKGSFFTF
jgi:hypothetical protein